MSFKVLLEASWTTVSPTQVSPPPPYEARQMGQGPGGGCGGQGGVERKAGRLPGRQGCTGWAAVGPHRGDLHLSPWVPRAAVTVTHGVHSGRDFWVESTSSCVGPGPLCTLFRTEASNLQGRRAIRGARSEYRCLHCPRLGNPGMWQWSWATSSAAVPAPCPGTQGMRSSTGRGQHSC